MACTERTNISARPLWLRWTRHVLAGIALILFIGSLFVLWRARDAHGLIFGLLTIPAFALAFVLLGIREALSWRVLNVRRRVFALAAIGAGVSVLVALAASIRKVH